MAGAPSATLDHAILASSVWPVTIIIVNEIEEKASSREWR